MSKTNQDTHSFICHRGKSIYRDDCNDRWYTYFGPHRLEHPDVEELKSQIDSVLDIKNPPLYIFCN